MANTLENFIPEIWSKKLIKLFDKSVVMAGLVNRDWEGEIKNAGDTIHVRQFGDITISSYTRNSTTISEQDIASTDNTMAIDQSKYFAFKVDDLDKAQSDIDAMEGYTKRAAIAIRNTIDARLLTHYADANASNVPNTSGTPVTLTPSNIYDYFVDQRKLLMDQDIDPDAEINVVINPAVHAVMLKSPELRDRSTSMVDETIRNGYLGKFAGLNVSVTTNYTAVSGTIPLMFFTRDFITFASQLTKLEHYRPHTSFSDAIKGLYLYGSKVFTNHAKAGGVLYVSNT